ncbi:hypothetical protein EYB53_024745 [Candidatus Chloroploca sp. M-50]|uniref:ParB/Sulfiredoxin domain-containing protein n=1 Tax=Candidatus Chloroploca mongolica TaxID=2528176 RepID=A0ABS4DHN8_9CHLR|nr:hypothetical protein [Candidatus Chloroploca mongolica]MBP1468940.1 hypothetical protein [Candidatus Chloroploca mongolica]
MMNSRVNLRSVDALIDLKRALNFFDQESIAALRAVEQELQATEYWLHERLTYWRMESQRQEQALRQAEAALMRCQSANLPNPRTGAASLPDCGAQQAVLVQARVKLQEAQQQLKTVQTYQSTVRHAATAYRDQVIQLTRKMTTIVPSARAFLDNRTAEIQAYLAPGAATATNQAPVTTPPPSPTGMQNIPTAGGSTKHNIQMIALDQIDLSTSTVTGSQDFRKVSVQEMIEGFHKLQHVVAPAVAQGADGDDFAQMDAAQGLDYAHGYQRIFDAFYGDSHIRLEKIGTTYTIINGQHRLFIARQLGVKAVPASVVVITSS